MSHTSMQWLRASATTVALALALGTPLGAHAAAEDPFFTALDRYGADDFSACARLLGELLQRGGRFPDGGELLLVECTAAAGDRSQAMDYVNQLLPRGRLSFDDLLHKDRPGLNALRADPAWPDMQRRVEAAEQQPSRNWTPRCAKSCWSAPHVTRPPSMWPSTRGVAMRSRA